MTGKTIAILGGGVGGLVVANELRRLLSREHHVVVVERNPEHAFAPSFLWLMTGDRRPAQISRDVSQLVSPGVEMLLAEACCIDLKARRVQTSDGALTYDYLVVALGAELVPEAIPGLSGAAHTFYTFEGAAKLRDALKDFPGGKIAVVVAALPFKCPAAPYEGAMLITDFFRKHGRQDKVELHLFTPEALPMPVAGPQLGGAVKQMVEARGIHFHPLYKLAAVDQRVRSLSFEGRESFKYEMLVVIPPHHGPRIVRESGLANEAGWVPVDPATLATKDENVYALGDVAAIPLAGRWKPDVPIMLPKAGVFAHDQGLVVARRLAARIAGTEAQDKFCGDGFCMLEAGEQLAGFAFGRFFDVPAPQVELRKMGRTWHIGKVLLERWWLTSPGMKRQLLQLGINLAARALRVPVRL